MGGENGFWSWRKRVVIRKNTAFSFLNLARFSNTSEMIFFMFWKEWAIAKLTTSAIGQNKHSYHEKIEKVVYVKILKANFHIFNEKIQVYRECHSIRNRLVFFH